jgi:hypothetical protein
MDALDELLADRPTEVRDTARRLVAIAREFVPGGLMRGRGAVHRHVRLTDPAQADGPALRDLMARAAAARRG